MSKYLKNIAVLFCLVALGCSPKVTPKSKTAAVSDLERRMILAGAEDEPMRVYKTDMKSDSLLLRSNSSKVAIPADKDIQHFISRLYATVRDSMSMGVGIAAPQVGVLKQIVWIQRFDKEGFPFEVYLNPEIKQYSTKKQDCREGCLSIPDRSDTTKTRAYAILIEYDKVDGSHHTEMIEDFTAVIFQHEIDHLHGKLYIDLL